MLQGKIIQLGKEEYGFEYESPLYNEPTKVRQVWRLQTFRCKGMSWCQETDAIDKPATLNVDGCLGISTVSCYLGNGNYFVGSMPSNEKAISCEQIPVPKPKVRGTTETRWYNGAWQKYSKREGWIAA